MADVHELALLSLNTAQQIDLELGGEESDPSVLRSFGDALSKMSGVGLPQTRAFLSYDPATTEIFAQAAGEVATHEISDIEALSEFMTNIVGPLIRDEHRLERDQLKAVKLFSLAFHRALLAHQLVGFEDDGSTMSDEFRTS